MSKTIQSPAENVSRDQIRAQIRDAIKIGQEAARDAALDAQAEARATAQGGGPQPPLPPLPALPPDGPVGIPGIGVPSGGNDVIPREAVDISIAFFITMAVIIVGYPIMRAIGKRIEGAAPVRQTVPADVRDQLQHIVQSVDAIAIEVERISEGQRFATKMLADRADNLAQTQLSGTRTP